jgi:hypothetical protein
MSWSRIAIEGSVIVVSILLAFGIDAAWAERQERRAEREVLVGLHGDFSEISQEMSRRGANARTQGDAIQDALDCRIDVPGRPCSGPRSINAAAVPGTPVSDPLFRALTVTGTFEPSEATLDGLVASGNLELLSDPGLRRSLNTWRNLLDEIQDNEAATRAYDFQTMIPYLASRFASVDIDDTKVVEDRWRGLVTDGEFQILAETKAAWMRSTAADYDAASALVQEILVALGEGLEPE